MRGLVGSGGSAIVRFHEKRGGVFIIYIGLLRQRRIAPCYRSGIIINQKPELWRE
nr:MAG TPA: hypothetical protein [Caudoviricetes sp.]